MKRLLLFLTILTFTFTLFACGDDDTIIDQSPTFSHLIVDSREPTENGVLDTYTKSKDETIVVEVHFNNPSNAPINSVTINGQRYRTNRFEEGSSPTVVILNLTLRVTGETLYEVENFVYSDVNSVNIDSSNKYQVFVRKNLPTATLSNLEQGSEHLTMEIRISDEDAVTIENSTTVTLYQGDTLIETKDILAGVINSVTFNDLLSNQTYNIKVTTDYNLDDGEGVVTNHVLLTDDTLATLEKDAPSASITLDEIKEESVDFSLTFTDTSSVLVEDGLDIIITQDGTIIDALEGVDITTLDEVSFTSLLNNNTYTISVYATYDLNDQEGIRDDRLLAQREFTTLQRPLPSIQAELISITEDTMQLYVDDTNITTDVDLSDLVLTIYDAQTDTILTQTAIIDDVVTVEITGLTAHTTVRATITASFDLEDGQGIREGVVFEDMYQTTSNEAPTGTIDAMTLSQTSVGFTMSITDTYNTVVEDTVEAHLYENNVLIDTMSLSNTSGTYTFENQAIYHDRSYRVTITTDYDLRDGTGVTEDYELSRFVKTDARPKAPEGTITMIEETASGLVVHYALYDYDNTLNTDGLTLHYHGESLILDPSLTSVTIADYHKGVAYDFELYAAYTTTQDYETTLASDTFTTIANDEPTLDADVTPFDSSITGNIIITDQDSTLEDYTVSIYRGSTLIHTQTSPSLNLFDLLSDTEYRIEITYTYDLNDTQGIQEDTVSTTVTTNAKDAPTITLDDASLTIEETTIEGNIVIDDPDATLEQYRVVLFKDSVEIASVSNQTTFSFSNLDSDTTYTIRIFSDYDLNKDGLKTDVLADDFTFTTLRYEAVTVDTVTEETLILNVDVAYLSEDFNLDTLIATVYDDQNQQVASAIFAENPFNLDISNAYADQELTLVLSVDDNFGNHVIIQTITTKTEANTAPTATISDVTQTQTTIDFVVSFDDPNETMLTQPIADLYVNGSSTPIQSIQLDVNETEYTFDNLEVIYTNTYDIRIRTDINLRDQAGIQYDYNIAAYTQTNIHKKAPTITLDSATFDPSTGITIDYTLYDFDDAIIINGVELIYNGTTITLDETQNHPQTMIISDYFNEDSTLYITLTYEDRYGDLVTIQTQTESLSISTLTEPTYSLTETITHDTISGTINWTDSDNTIQTYSISLYHGETLIDTITDTDTYSFTGLYSNESYRIEVDYTYDMNISAGLTDETDEYTRQTNALTEATLSLINETTTTDSISGDIDITDPDNTLLTYDVILRIDGVEVDRVTDQNTFTFTGLYSDQAYTIDVVYQYDLNEITGTETRDISDTYQTDALSLPTVTVDTITHTLNTMTLDINVLDSDATLNGSISVMLYDGTILIETQTIAATDSVTFTNLTRSTTYTIVIEADIDQNLQTGTYTHSFAEFDETTPNYHPTLTYTEELIEQERIEFYLNIDDIYGIQTDNLVRIELLDESLAQVGSSDYIESDMKVKLMNLYSDHTYTVNVYIQVDFQDGTGVQEILLDTETFTTDAKTTPTLSVAETIDTTSIQGSLTWTDPDAIKSSHTIQLYRDGVLEETLTDVDNFNFTGLFSNTTYTVDITYTYNLNDGQGVISDTVTYTYTTDALTEPTVTPDNLVITDDAISGDLVVSDPDVTIDTYTATLYHDGAIIGSVTDAASFNFSGLLSDETYTLTISVTYDTNEVNHPTTKETDYTYTTVALTAPTLAATNETVTSDTISGDVSITDPDSTLMTYTVELFLDGNPVASVIDTPSFNFTNLFTDSTYDLIITYSYDLGDGAGTINNSVTTTYTTDALTVPTGEIDLLTVTGTTIEADISEILDPDNVLLTADVVLFADNIEVERIATIGDETVTFTTPYDSNTQYVVKLIITYDLNDQESTQTLTLDQVAYIEATKN